MASPTGADGNDGSSGARFKTIASITRSGTTVTVGFEGSDGWSYSLNKSLNLDFTTPNIKSTVTLSGSTTGTLQDTDATESAAFYRVERQ